MSDDAILYTGEGDENADWLFLVEDGKYQREDLAASRAVIDSKNKIRDITIVE